MFRFNVHPFEAPEESSSPASPHVLRVHTVLPNNSYVTSHNAGEEPDYGIYGSYYENERKNDSSYITRTISANDYDDDVYDKDDDSGYDSVVLRIHTWGSDD